LLLYQNNY